MYLLTTLGNPGKIYQPVATTGTQVQQINNILIANDSLDGMHTALEKAATIEHYSGADIHVAEVIYDAIAEESEEHI